LVNNENVGEKLEQHLLREEENVIVGSFDVSSID
jgi:hypothetical protein